MSDDAELEQLLGRSLDDDQRSRFYDIERQGSSEYNRSTMPWHMSFFTMGTDRSHAFSEDAQAIDSLAESYPSH